MRSPWQMAIDALKELSNEVPEKVYLSKYKVNVEWACKQLRSVRALQKTITEQQELLVRYRDAGALMSNICFNLGQESSAQEIDLQTKRIMRNMQRDWDALPKLPHLQKKN